MNEQVKVYFKNNEKILTIPKEFKEFKKNCMKEFNLFEDDDNYIFFVKIQDLTFEVSNQNEYFDNLISEINIPIILIEEKNTNLNELNQINEIKKLKETIENIRKELIEVNNEIQKKEEFIKVCNDKIEQNQKLLNDNWEKAEKKIKQYLEEINKLKNPIYVSSKIKSQSVINSNMFQSGISISSLQSNKLKVFPKSIPSIKKNIIDQNISIILEIENQGPSVIPYNSKLSIIEENSPFQIISDTVLSKDQNINVNQKVIIDLKLAVDNERIIQNGMTQVTLKLYHSSYGNFGKEFTINIAVVD